jgi:hypothetical protein
VPLPAPHTPPAPVPIPAVDPLLADTLRAATEAYIRGDYLRAANLWADASCIFPIRPEHHAWRFIADTLTNRVAMGELLNVDASLVGPEAAQ